MLWQLKKYAKTAKRVPSLRAKERELCYIVESPRLSHNKLWIYNSVNVWILSYCKSLQRHATDNSDSASWWSFLRAESVQLFNAKLVLEELTSGCLHPAEFTLYSHLTLICRLESHATTLYATASIRSWMVCIGWSCVCHLSLKGHLCGF